MFRSLFKRVSSVAALASVSSALAFAAGVSGSFQMGPWIGSIGSIPLEPTPEPTVALVWTERISDGYSVVRLGYDTGTYATYFSDPISYQGGVSPGFASVEYSEGKILVVNEVASISEFYRTEKWGYAAVVENVGADSEALPDGSIWTTTPHGPIRKRPTLSSTLWHNDLYGNSDMYFDQSYIQTTRLDHPDCGKSLRIAGDEIFFDTVGGANRELAGIYRRKLDGSDSPVPVFTDLEAQIVDFEIAGDHLYFGDKMNGAIRRIDLDGTDLITLVADAGDVNSIEVTETAIYWSDSSGRIRRSDLEGNNPTTLRSGIKGLGGVAVVPLTYLAPDSLPQAIHFSGLRENYGGAANIWIEFSAEALSEEAVTMKVLSGPANIYEGPAGKRHISFSGAGTVVIRATAAGNYSYAPIDTTFEINSNPLLKQTIDFPPPEVLYLGDAPLTYKPVATASSGLPVGFNLSSTSLAGIAKLLSSSEIKITGPGAITVLAYQNGNSTYASASFVERTIQVVMKKQQAITFNPALAATYGDAPINLVATSNSELPVAFEIISGPARLDGSKLVLTGAGKVVVEAVQAGANDYLPAPTIRRTITVNKAVLTVFIADAVRPVGRPNPEFELSYEGFVEDDNEFDLDARPVAFCKAATIKSPAGGYPVSIKGGLDDNYTFLLGAPGKLTVVGFAGSYETLLADSAGVPLGKLELTASSNALTYTGTLHLASESGSITVASNSKIPASSLNPVADVSSATATWSRAAVPAKSVSALSLRIDLAGDTLVATLTREGASPLSGSGSRVFTQALDPKNKKIPAPWIGAHTLVLRDPVALDPVPFVSLPAPGAVPLPLGSGHASVTIAANGVMTIKGKLPDGTSLTASARATATVGDDTTGLYRLFARPNSTRLDSFFSGPLALEKHPDQTRFKGRFHVAEEDGLLFWAKAPLPPATKPANQDKSYRKGFACDLVAILDPWIAPNTKIATVNGVAIPAGNLAQRLGLTDSATTAVQLAVAYGPDNIDLGQRSSQLPVRLGLSAKNAVSIAEPVTSPLNITKFAVSSFAASTGAFAGSFVLLDPAPTPAKPAATKERKVAFSGTFRQGPNGPADTLGYAHFLLDPSVTDTSDELISGELLLSAPPATP